MKYSRMICPCYGMDYVIEEFDIHWTCGWKYDPVQNANPKRKGGANKDSIVDHRNWFLKMS